MTKTWLLLDCNYLCYRAYYAMGQLAFGDIQTGVVFGFLRDVINLQDLHATNRLVFCWDSPSNLRKLACPTYKAGRHDEDDEDEAFRKRQMRKQMNSLRKDYLPSLGYQNILCQKGYEADDMIAVAIDALPRKHHAIIVSSDHDLYQLLGKRVSIWNPHAGRAITADSFSKEWGLSPNQWVDVKSIAGCSSDNIPGVVGVGEKTAAKFMRGKLPADTATFQKIVKGNKIWRKNMQLVRLPYPGTEPVDLYRDRVPEQDWQQLADKLGFKSIRDRVPGRPKSKGFDL